ncbi:MAG: low-specificity L-threonine aldolase [candidate division NC10 bacterium]|nr:low-specificity L-threonine aldolase [candidate division NC10 bacterium]
MADRRKVIDLRSDTVTLPTEAMREAMKSAELGDDVFEEDPTVNRLQELAARRLGKEAALFVTSGTMGNLVGLLTHTSRGDEIILEETSHIYNYEVAGMAALGGLLARPLKGTYGILDPEDVRRAIRSPNIHHPKTQLICLESTHNRGGGTFYPPETLKAIADVAREAGIPMHLDGARIFNAAVAAGVPAAEFAACADSVTFCLSKGLSAPVGSLLVGRASFIERARRFRKMVGGGMRQAGVLAAAGIVALETMVERLTVDHENARLLAEGLARLPGIEIDLKRVQTNIVIFDVRSPKTSAPRLVQELDGEGIKLHLIAQDSIRAVAHKDLDREDILLALQAIEKRLA